MTAPDFSSPFKLAVAASDVAAGAVLLKENDEGVEHLVCFFPRIASKVIRITPPLKKSVWHEC